MVRTTVALWAAFILAGCAPQQDFEQTALAPRVELPDSPDGTLREIATQLSRNNPAALWAALPSRHQDDVQGLLRQLATKIDAKTYDTSFALARRIAVLLDEKKSFFLRMPMLKMAGTDAKKLEENWGAFARLVRTLTESEISSIDRLAKLDVEAFLRGTGSRFMTQLSTLAASSKRNPFEQLRNVEFKVLEVNENVASVRVQQKGKKRSSTVKLSRVDGKWLPAEIVAGWEAQIKKAKAKLAKMTPKESSMATTMALKMIEGVVEQLEAAETQEDFDKVFASLFAMRPRPGR